MYGPVFAQYYDELGWDRFPRSFAEVLFAFLRSQDCEVESMLDVACGTGVLLGEMRRLIPGLQVTGLDQSEEMLKVGAQRLGAGYPPADLIKGDMTGFFLGRKFDIVTCTFDALNHILEAEGIRCAFASVASHLDQGGWYVADVNTEFALRTAWDGFSVDHRGGHTVIQKSMYDPRKRVATQAIEAMILRDGLPVAHFNEVFYERAYPVEDLVRWMSDTGLEVRYLRDMRGNDIEDVESVPRVFLYAVKR